MSNRPESADYFADDSSNFDSTVVAEPETGAQSPTEIESLEYCDTLPNKRSWAYMFSCCLGHRRRPRTAAGEEN